MVIGLTGGIASGKSTVSDFIGAQGIAVVDTDLIAREEVAAGSAGLHALVQEFGAEILRPDGLLDRRRMRERVFADATAKSRLEAIVHPRIRNAALVAVARARPPYVLLVVPLLIESGQYDWVDRITVVDVPQALQLARVQDRDGVNRETAERMVAAQAMRSERLLAADEVICNHGSREQLLAQVTNAHRRYLVLAGSPVVPHASAGGFATTPGDAE